MTTLTLADLNQLPEIVVGEAEHRLLTIIALTDLGETGTNTDLLLYELDRARVVPDSTLPRDAVRIGSIVRYRAAGEDERMVKLVMPNALGAGGGYLLPVTTEHGAALLGTRPGQVMAWVGADGEIHRIAVGQVANHTLEPDPDPGPVAA